MTARARIRPRRGATPAILRFAVAGLALLLQPGDLRPQTPALVSARVADWAVDSGHLGFQESRPGAAVAAGVGGAGGALRVSAGFAPQGDVAPGWVVVLAEAEPRIPIGDVAALGVRLSAGGHYMDVRNRHAVMERCTEEAGCMFEAPGFGQGWSAIGGVAVTAAVALHPRLELTGGLGLSRLAFGANPGERLRDVTLGLEYRFRPGR